MVDQGEREGWGGGGNGDDLWHVDGAMWNLIIIGPEPNAPLASDPGTEHHLPIISKIGGHWGQLEIEIDREREM